MKVLPASRPRNGAPCGRAKHSIAWRTWTSATIGEPTRPPRQFDWQLRQAARPGDRTGL